MFYWLQIKKGNNDNIERYHKVADKDITVYKIGNKLTKLIDFFKENDFLRQNIFIPKVLNKEQNIKYIETDEVDGGTDSFVISDGYFSFSEECGIEVKPFMKDDFLISVRNDNDKEAYYATFGNNIIGKFIIPQGSNYYKNEDGGIVSSNIIWTGEYHLIDKIEKEKIIQLKGI